MCNFATITRKKQSIKMKIFYKVTLISSVILITTVGFIHNLLFTPYSATNTASTFYVDKNDTKDSVINKITQMNPEKALGFICAYKLFDIPTRMGKYQIKPEILGGLVIECGTKLIDDSIKGKLERLELLMKGTK